MKVVGVWMSDSKVDSIGLNTLLREKRSDLLFRKNYAKSNPHVLFIDSPISLKCLLTRLSQFSLLRDIVAMSDIRNEIFVPKFCLLPQKDPTKLCDAGISYPIVCKSLMAHGNDNVHKIAIVFNDSGLDHLTYPIFVQQFIKHNGKVLKLFVVGDHSCVTEVPSIKNHDKSVLSERQLEDPIYLNNSS
uniref:inositol-1,3,4-trisphosphate 5/6-kinase n=1 Tax=Schistosoma haematobium TaxID=6185 RepID=A0A095ALJ0_SCHHA